MSYKIHFTQNGVQKEIIVKTKYKFLAKVFFKSLYPFTKIDRVQKPLKDY